MTQLTFAHPWVLVFMAIPVLLAWTVIARAPGVVSPADHTRQRARPWLARTLGFFDAVPCCFLLWPLPSSPDRKRSNIPAANGRSPTSKSASMSRAA